MTDSIFVRPRASPGCRSSRSARRSPASRRQPTTAWCEVAAELNATSAQVGLAWLLAHAPNTLLIAGTESIGHLEDNVGVGELVLSADQLARLDAVAVPNASPPSHGIEGFAESR